MAKPTITLSVRLSALDDNCVNRNNNTKRSKGKFKRKLKRIFSNPFTYIAIIIIISICIATCIVHAYEADGKTDSEIFGWFDTIWHTIVAVSAAYFDYYVKSIPGRMASLVLLLFGMIVFSFITSKITSGFMNILMKNNKGLRKLRAMKNHFIMKLMILKIISKYYI